MAAMLMCTISCTNLREWTSPGVHAYANKTGVTFKQNRWEYFNIELDTGVVPIIAAVKDIDGKMIKLDTIEEWQTASHDGQVQFPACHFTFEDDQVSKLGLCVSRYADGIWHYASFTKKDGKQYTLPLPSKTFHELFGDEGHLVEGFSL